VGFVSVVTARKGPSARTARMIPIAMVAHAVFLPVIKEMMAFMNGSSKLT
jgi:hypothetical protein